MTAVVLVGCSASFTVCWRRVLTGFDVQLGRPDALPAYTFDRALLRDIAVFPQLHAAVLV